jgi:hypothetical protein|tara:strand:+ start:4707 stop:4994 length:288 start_codon:yes stop_codon:yes gene_type:complete
MDDAACTSSVSNKREAPVVVAVESRKPARIPVSRSSLISEVQLYLPICISGGPLVVGKLVTVGLALVVAYEEGATWPEEAPAIFPDAGVVDCDAS